MVPRDSFCNSIFRIRPVNFPANFIDCCLLTPPQDLSLCYVLFYLTECEQKISVLESVMDRREFTKCGVNYVTRLKQESIDLEIM